ncbi:hypothetical protein L6452_42159 [Arctium lappa]|uniref:Uncharacterized protein n=1 Tax=Arctium lappa TaxID=4217 RepID=A0ACB8XLJ8_ARCLA|nr:hypothetical protein L6452_42159 [Arctium lappa]
MSDTSNQQSPEMSDTSNQPLQDSPEQPISPCNHPCGDLLDRDWEEAKNIIDSNRESRDLLGYSISQDKETPLHTAIRSQNIKIVEHLVDRMTEHQLVLQDKYGYTALFDVAAVGNVDMARAMVEKCPQLLKIRDCVNMLPIFFAALYGKHNIVAYLYGKYKSMAGNDWTNEDIHEVFLKCIEANLFGMCTF